MSAQCNRFVQNAWKKEFCSNCFKPREEHTSNEDALRFNIEKASSNLKADSFRLQSILRVKESVQKDQKKKNVAFPEFLTEVIGYGGDDFLSDDEEDIEQVLVDSLNAEEDAIPDSEEERTLSNLTRANTNFNTVTANLSEIIPTNEMNKSSTTAAASTRTFASLMLGRIQKDADGRKTTLLVSVTPFGGDESLPTAKRPSDRKITVNGFSNVTKSATLNNSMESKNEITLKTLKKITVDRKDDKREQSSDSSKLEKIVDMPLITSTNLISVIQRNESTEIDNTVVSITDKNLENATNSAEFGVKCEKKLASISRSPAIKKTDNEKPKIAIQLIQSNNNSNCSNYEFSKNIEKECPMKENEIKVNLTSLKKNEEAAESDRPLILRDKKINKITAVGVDDKKTEKTDSSEAIVEKFNFKESRELAGEPDGKADEEEIIEPPALPRSPPPMESRSSIQGETDKVSLIATEPRPSFLHGSVSMDAKSKPVVPQKPSTFVGTKSVLPESEPTCDISSANMKRINANYVLPPPSVQNVTNRTLPSTGTVVSQIPNSTRYVTKTEVENSSLNIIGRSVTTNKVTKDKMERNDQINHRTSVSTYESVKEKKAISTNGRDIGESTDAEEDGLEPTRLVNNKRRMAPRPPEVTEDLPTSSSLFARNPSANLKSDSPVVREKEKRERASSCSPKFRKAVCEAPDPTGSSHSNDEPSSSSSKRTISLSQDSLTNGSETREGKKRGRSRFSLKRFLRMGSRKDVDMTSGHTSNSRLDEIPSTPQPKLRLEIIHPLELDGAAVEVVGNDRITRIGEDQTDFCGSRSEATKTTRSPNGSQQYSSTDLRCLFTVRPGKPPPPPRNQSLENWSRVDQSSKPIRPPPPRVETTQQFLDRNEKSVGKMTTTTTTTMTTTAPSSWQPSNSSSASSDLIYANLGEVRSALAPSKPQRTASMRDQTTSQPLIKKHGSSSQNLNQNDYETAATITLPTSDSLTLNDSHVYECLSSSPECDSNLELRHGNGSHHPSCKRKSDSSVMDPGVEFKFNHHHHHHHHHHQPFLRSTSLPYCGSETESELYAPYTFYTGDEGAEEDQDWKSKDDELRLNQLRQRRGRSIVHRSLEDNYGAVIVANHEALAQFVEQLQVNQVAQVPVSLRALKNLNPRLCNFTIDTNTSVFIGRRIFCSASWNEQNVSLCIAFDQAMHVSRKEFYLAPIIEFIETVPKEISERVSLSAGKDMEAAISVFPRLQVSTIQGFGLATKDSQDEGITRESSFVLLQFVNALKSLQARGIEESSKSLSNVILCREEKDVCYRLYLLQGLNVDTCDVKREEKISLCQCALVALQQLHLTKKLPLVQELLLREKAVTLSQIKSLLEFTLWGPADVTLGGPREREVALQRWLDLERATILHALVRTRAPLTITDEYQLLFLVRTSAKMMCEASILLDEQRNRLSRVC
ncbi:uncharacterized protein LOC124957596 isoform X2 [Vespa velutina]|uniref:uncharacterized protein LOC124957596 isoform X2 n=1 Tax=Vespa velutina TaxID=202808 RepID=UPI001FB3A57F|nr:uncharacterized protein LOC124957596 isoform X2 [Vespa velutina]